MIQLELGKYIFLYLKTNVRESNLVMYAFVILSSGLMVLRIDYPEEQNYGQFCIAPDWTIWDTISQSWRISEIVFQLNTTSQEWNFQLKMLIMERHSCLIRHFAAKIVVIRAAKRIKQSCKQIVERHYL